MDSLVTIITLMDNMSNSSILKENTSLPCKCYICHVSPVIEGQGILFWCGYACNKTSTLAVSFVLFDLEALIFHMCIL